MDSCRHVDIALPPHTLSARIDRAEMLRYLGYAGQEITGELAERIGRIAQTCEDALAPRGTARCFSVVPVPGAPDVAPAIDLAGTTVRLRGKSAFLHLKDARFCAVLACTLGAESERRLRALAATDPLGATLFDAACSAYVEAGTAALEAEVRARAERAGHAINWRFSPGYGDLPLNVQPDLLAALDAARGLGITCTSSNMLVPSKSVTAFVGLFDAAPASADAPHPCSLCRLREACSLRARGVTCRGAGEGAL